MEYIWGRRKKRVDVLQKAAPRGIHRLPGAEKRESWEAEKRSVAKKKNAEVVQGGRRNRWPLGGRLKGEVVGLRSFRVRR